MRAARKEINYAKKMLVDELLGKELLKEDLGKSYEPRAQATDCRESYCRGTMQWTRSVSPFWPVTEPIFL